MIKLYLKVIEFKKIIIAINPNINMHNTKTLIYI